MSDDVLVSQTILRSGPSAWFIYHQPSNHAQRGKYELSRCGRTIGTTLGLEEMLRISVGHQARPCKWCSFADSSKAPEPTEVTEKMLGPFGVGGTPCSVCGHITVPFEGAFRCLNCGADSSKAPE